jgi:ABC-type transport system involved in cytochrome bd biosynthesis fused ATPase/permease subunit
MAKIKYVPYVIFLIIYGTLRAITKFRSQWVAVQMATQRARTRRGYISEQMIQGMPAQLKQKPTA